MIVTSCGQIHIYCIDDGDAASPFRMMFSDHFEMCNGNFETTYKWAVDLLQD